MLKCSYCGKENADDSPFCGGCGTALGTAPNNVKAGLTAEIEDPRRVQGKKRMVSGALWFFGGSAVTLVSYLAAVSSPYGGHYVIAWGAVVFGAIRFFQGRAAAAGRVDHNSQARELLALAAQFESVDREKAVALYDEIVRTFVGTAASREAQRNIQALTSGKAHVT